MMSSSERDTRPRVLVGVVEDYRPGGRVDARSVWRPDERCKCGAVYCPPDPRFVNGVVLVDTPHAVVVNGAVVACSFCDKRLVSRENSGASVVIGRCSPGPVPEYECELEHAVQVEVLLPVSDTGPQFLCAACEGPLGVDGCPSCGSP